MTPNQPWLAGWVSRATAAIVAMAAACVPAESTAQDVYPSKAIRIIVPFTPGASDLQIRTLGPLLTAKLGQPIVIVNIPGGGGIVAAQQVQRAKPDGYTLYFTGSAGLTLVPAFRPEVPYRLEDFTPIANVSTLPGVMVTRTSQPFKNGKEFIAYAKANPGKLTFGSAGFGTASHTFGVGPQAYGGFSLNHIPYKGMAEVIQSIVGGQVDVGFAIPSLVISYVRAGTLQALAVSSATRNEYLPDVPTYRELGIDYVDGENYGLVGPKGLPAPIVERLSAAMAEAMKSPEFLDVMKRTLTSTLYMGPEQYSAFLLGREKDWARNLSNPAFADVVKR